jgi:hypothetical protein
MTADSPTPAITPSRISLARRTRTGGPDDGDGDGRNILEHVLGWTLVVVLAMLVTQLGLL